MLKIAIIAAMPSELEGAFEKEDISITYTGLGKVNAAHAVTELILSKRPSCVVNLGTAGSRSYSQGAVVECCSVVQRDMDVTPMGMPLGVTPYDEIAGTIELATYLSHLPRGICGTGDSFEIGTPRLPCDLVDMEAYALAKICKRMNVGFSALKFITDGSDDTAHMDWKENLKFAPLRLYEEFTKLRVFLRC